MQIQTFRMPAKEIESFLRGRINRHRTTSGLVTGREIEPIRIPDECYRSFSKRGKGKKRRTWRDC